LIIFVLKKKHGTFTALPSLVDILKSLFVWMPPD
jgi:hypothetical protein